MMILVNDVIMIRIDGANDKIVSTKSIRTGVETDPSSLFHKIDNPPEALPSLNACVSSVKSEISSPSGAVCSLETLPSSVEDAYAVTGCVTINEIVRIMLRQANIKLPAQYHFLNLLILLLFLWQFILQLLQQFRKTLCLSTSGGFLQKG